MVDIASSKKEKKPAIKVTGMPGKHVPPGPGGVVGKLNDLIAAVSFILLFFCYYGVWGGLVKGSEAGQGIDADIYLLLRSPPQTAG